MKSFLFSSVLISLAATVFADDDDVCSNSTTVKTQSDLDSLSSCGSFDGDIEFDSSFSGVANINGINNITGDLIVNNATALSSLSASDLTAIGGSFELTSLTILDTLSFPVLKSVQTISWTTLPILTQVQFNDGVDYADTVVISDTALKSLDGITLNNASTLNINNNRYLLSIDFDVTFVSNALDVSFNGDNVNASFPYLLWANNITIRDVAEVDFPLLESINASIGFINNSIEYIYAPNLTSIGSSLSIVSNDNITRTNFSSLKTIGGALVIANNSAFMNISGFDSLETVNGAIDLIGSFNETEFPELDTVRGGVTIDTDEVYNCSTWNNLHSKGGIQGDSYACSAKSLTTSVSLVPSSTADSDSAASTSSGGASGTSTTSASATSASKKSGAVRSEIALSLAGLCAIVGAVFFF